jgi:hypothetical protein
VALLCIAEATRGRRQAAKEGCASQGAGGASNSLPAQAAPTTHLPGCWAAAGSEAGRDTSALLCACAAARCRVLRQAGACRGCAAIQAGRMGAAIWRRASGSAAQAATACSCMVPLCEPHAPPRRGGGQDAACRLAAQGRSGPVGQPMMRGMRVHVPWVRVTCGRALWTPPLRRGGSTGRVRRLALGRCALHASNSGTRGPTSPLSPGLQVQLHGQLPPADAAGTQIPPPPPPPAGRASAHGRASHRQSWHRSTLRQAGWALGVALRRTRPTLRAPRRAALAWTGARLPHRAPALCMPRSCGVATFQVSARIPSPLPRAASAVCTRGQPGPSIDPRTPQSSPLPACSIPECVVAVS